MKKENLTVSLPPEWMESLKQNANNKGWFLTHYVREIIRADLNLPPSLITFERAMRRETRKASVNSKTLQLRLPRKAQDIILGMAVQTGWSVSSIVQRIIEKDLEPMPSPAIISPVNQNQLVREYSQAGAALGVEHWEEYYLANPKPAIYKLEVSIPLDWPDALQAKANMSATTPYLLVRTALMKRFFGKDYILADA